ncbi:MAG: Gfo/Idh/MocA family protein [Candidatus Competibacterales bacterium]
MPHSVAIIGLGIMGRRMLAAMGRHPDFEVVTLWDPAEAALARVRSEVPRVEVATSASAAMEAAQLVYLACPPLPRRELALEASAMNRALFLEKPLGVDTAASASLVEALGSANTQAVVNFVLANARAFNTLEAAIARDVTGPVVGIDIVVTYPQWPRAWQMDAHWLKGRAEGGFTREVISHFIFAAQRLLGELQVVWARPSYPSDDDGACETHLLARLENPAGVPVSVLGTTGGAQPDRQELTVKGTRRSYRLAEFYQLWVSEGGAWEEALIPPADPRADTLQRQLDQVALWLQGKPQRLATAAEALGVQRCIEGMLTTPP